LNPLIAKVKFGFLKRNQRKRCQKIYRYYKVINSKKGSVFHCLTNLKNIFNTIDDLQIDVSVIRKGELQNG